MYPCEVFVLLLLVCYYVSRRAPTCLEEELDVYFRIFGPGSVVLTNRIVQDGRVAKELVHHLPCR